MLNDTRPTCECMIDLPESFLKYSLTALPLDERPALLYALREEEMVRGVRLRPGASVDRMRGVLGDCSPIPWASNAYAIPINSRAGAHPLHEAGAYYLQEPSAMSPAVALGAKPYERVLDLCAAPGGKCVQIAGMMDGKGILVANEVVPARAKVLSRNIERMGIPNAIVTNESPKKLAERWRGFFDRILVDAPCSGEGMFRRDPGGLAAWDVRLIPSCAERQLQILESASDLLRDGGTLVYSTCTFNETEDEGVVDRFCQKHPEFSRENFCISGVGNATDGCLRLWPHRVLGEGHFIAKLVKKEPTQIPIRKNDDNQLDLIKLLPEFSGISVAGILFQMGDRFWALPDGLPDLTGIKVLRRGLGLCYQRGKTLIPDQALAHFLPVDLFPQKVEVSERDAFKYLAGETLNGEGLLKGFVAVCLESFALGFAKCSEGVLKNYLPKGLQKRTA